ncbi:MAG: hypothetical protein JNJ58_06445 [Chitinophagaceae bacterium]|nr:hypothetical protein [Chitinophagaceae bacterium]
MSKKLIIILILTAAVLISAFFLWNWVNQASTDFADQKAEKRYHCTQLLTQISQDTASFNQLKQKLVAVEGHIKKITREDSSLTIEMGDTNAMSSIIFQIDKRHLSSFQSCKEGDSTCIKGIVTAFTQDLELGLGNTLEMNFCSLEK